MKRVLAVALMLLPAACRRARQAPPDERIQAMEGLALSQSEHGEPVWTLRATRALLREDQRVALLDEPVIEFYERGKAVSRINARAGQVAVDTHDVLLSSAVVLDSYADRARLTTDFLVYSAERGRLSTTAAVLIRRPEGELRGKGLEAKPDLSEIRIREQRSVLTGRPR